MQEALGMLWHGSKPQEHWGFNCVLPAASTDVWVYLSVPIGLPCLHPKISLLSPPTFFFFFNSLLANLTSFLTYNFRISPVSAYKNNHTEI